MVVLTLMGILLSLAAPSFQRAVEQARADVAVANLKAIWTAQRAYWMDNRAYTADLTVLQAGELIDASILSDSSPYVFSVSWADGSSFEVSAARRGSNAWTGGFAIDQSGLVSGSIQSDGQAAIVPSNL